MTIIRKVDVVELPNLGGANAARLSIGIGRVRTPGALTPAGPSSRSPISKIINAGSRISPVASKVGEAFDIPWEAIGDYLETDVLGAPSDLPSSSDNPDPELDDQGNPVLHQLRSADWQTYLDLPENPTVSMATTPGQTGGSGVPTSIDGVPTGSSAGGWF